MFVFFFFFQLRCPKRRRRPRRKSQRHPLALPLRRAAMPLSLSVNRAQTMIRARVQPSQNPVELVLPEQAIKVVLDPKNQNTSHRTVLRKLRLNRKNLSTQSRKPSHRTGLDTSLVKPIWILNIRNTNC